jgi:hypothetical protein
MGEYLLFPVLFVNLEPYQIKHFLVCSAIPPNEVLVFFSIKFYVIIGFILPTVSPLGLVRLALNPCGLNRIGWVLIPNKSNFFSFFPILSNPCVLGITEQALND